MKTRRNMMNQIMSVAMLLAVALTSLLGFTQHVDARVMNVEDKGSLTIHKFLNPDIKPAENGGPGFQGDGTTTTILPGDTDPSSGNGAMLPLPGVEFSVYGPLSKAEADGLVIEGSQGTNYDPTNPKPLDALKVGKFIEGKDTKRKGLTNTDGILTFNDIEVNTNDLADNIYLVVETKTPTSDKDGKPIVQQPSMPVLVNIPSTNPKVDGEGSEVDNYNYDVHLFMKNYNQTEPDIEKEADKPTHSVGEAIKYSLTISPLAFDMNEYQELEVTDELDEQLNFLELGHAPSVSAEDSVVFYRSSGKDEEKIIMEAGKDYTVTHPERNENGPIKWVFTKTGIEKLEGITAGDGSRIVLMFTAVTNEKVKPNGTVPNTVDFDFVNKWGYGTKPPKPGEPGEPGEPTDPTNPPKPVNPPKPSPIVNTVFGERDFLKRDKQDKNETLAGAEFLVRNTSVKEVTALDEKGELKTYPANTPLYAIITNTMTPTYPLDSFATAGTDPVRPWMKGNQYVIGWTDEWDKAFTNGWTVTSDEAGKFHVEGLEYSNAVHFRKMYIFKEMGIQNVNGSNVEYVKEYQYELANPRTAGTTQANIDAEIAGILAQHKGEDNGNGAWKFYKESDADATKFKLDEPKDRIDYLGSDAVNNYELIEVRAPEGYAPVEKDMAKLMKKATALPDEFEHPFAFTVPGMDKDGNPIYSDDSENVVDVPNAKLPKIPLTGGIGTIIFLVIGLVLLVGAFVLRRTKLNRV